MSIQHEDFFNEQWRWSKFQKYLIAKLEKYNFNKFKISPEYSYKESSYGSKKENKTAKLYTSAGHNDRINFARSVCISSPSYSVLNFLIIPNPSYNVPFFGLDFVSLPNYHLIVLDFQPSLIINKQFEESLLKDLLSIKDEFHKKVPRAEKMTEQISQFFSPAVIWSKLPIEESSDRLIENYLYPTFKKYLDVYLKVLFQSKKVDLNLQTELVKGQNIYLNYRKRKDPARPMLKALFGESFTESLINNLLFRVK